MALQSINPTETKSWQKLQEHFSDMQNISMQKMFQEDVARVQKFHIRWDKFLVDYSKNKINSKTIELLLDLANEMRLKEAIQSYFSGENINQTENRAVLHTALRASEEDVIFADGENVIPQVFEVKNAIRKFSETIISGERKGFTGKAITDVVNIGIGG